MSCNDWTKQRRSESHPGSACHCAGCSGLMNARCEMRAPRPREAFEAINRNYSVILQVSGVGKSRVGTTVPESFDIATAGQKVSGAPERDEAHG